MIVTMLQKSGWTTIKCGNSAGESDDWIEFELDYLIVLNCDESCDSGNSGDYHWWSGESDDSDATYESDNPWEYSDSGELIEMANQLNMVILMELQTIFIMGEFGESRDSGDSDESGKSSKCGYSGDSCESDDSGEWDHSGKVV